MRPTVTDLQSSDFNLLTQFKQQNAVPFLLEYYFERRTWIVLLHYALTLATFFAFLLASVNVRQPSIGRLATLGVIFIGFLVLIPIHEGIHAFFYWLFGAKGLHFSGSIKYLYAYVIADHFVVRSGELAFLALAPFLILTPSLLTIALVFRSLYAPALGLLMVHTAATSGDWAILNYLWSHRGIEVYSYDDAASGTSYFYERVREQE